MHRCLKIDEILIAVAQDASMSDDMLLAMALTCRTFYGAAMDKRWREISEIRKLLYNFPRNVVMIEYESELGRWFWVRVYSYYSCFALTKKQGFKRALTPAEWDRFNHYAKRVQVMRALCLEDKEAQTSQQPLLLDVSFQGLPCLV